MKTRSVLLLVPASDANAFRPVGDRRPANERPIVSAAREDFKSALEGIVFVTSI
jgi:hypothetical protein